MQNAHQLDRLTYTLDPDEDPQKREKEIQEIGSLVNHIGRKLGFVMDKGNPLTWYDDKKEPVYQFFITSNTVFTPLLMKRIQNRSCTPVILFSRQSFTPYHGERTP